MNATMADNTTLPASKEDFIASGITLITIADLGPSDRECDICKLEYGDKELNDEPESPVKINACGHVFGQKCLEKHVAGNRDYARRCPMCRDLLYDAPSMSPSAIAIIGQGEISAEDEWHNRLHEVMDRHEALHTTMDAFYRDHDAIIEARDRLNEEGSHDAEGLSRLEVMLRDLHQVIEDTDQALRAVHTELDATQEEGDRRFGGHQHE